MAGTISFSLSQQFDKYGEPLAGGKLYFYQAGTTNPQNAFKDSNLTLPWPNPIELDEAGRIPQFFLADGSIKIRLADINGVTQIAADGVLVIGPSSGGGGGTPVDATTVLQTGDLKVRYGTGSHTGWVRANGRTIGSSTSGASERSNADCQALFEYLWGVDGTLMVSSGRGVSANADWVANKTIALPNWSGAAIIGLDDMGNGAAGRLTTAIFGTDPTVLGAFGGVEKITLTSDQIPAHTHSDGTLATTVPTTVSRDGWGNQSGTQPGPGVSITQGRIVVGSGQNELAENLESLRAAGNDVTLTGSASSDVTGATGSIGGGQAHANVQPSKAATIYLKL